MLRNPSHSNFPSNCLAKALYDNVAEAPDELAFRKGDILTVLEQNTNSLEGWWLCSLRGRQGIVPGNRLRLLPGMYDPTGLGNAGSNGISDVSHALRRSWASNPNKVITPQKIGAVYLYDIPPGTKFDRGEMKSSSPVPRYPLQGAFAGLLLKQNDNGLPGDGGKFVFVKGATYNGCFWDTLLHGEDGLAFNLGSGDSGGESSYKTNHA